MLSTAELGSWARKYRGLQVDFGTPAKDYSVAVSSEVEVCLRCVGGNALWSPVLSFLQHVCSGPGQANSLLD